MRRSRIAIGLLVVAGLVVGYRVTQSGRPRDASQPEGRTAGAPGVPEPPVESRASQPEAARATEEEERAAASAKRETPAEGAVADSSSSATRHAAPSSAAAGTSRPGSGAAPPVVTPPDAPTVAHVAPVPPPTVPPPAPAVDPDSDHIPPALQSLRFDPPEIQDGGVAVLTVGAADNLSGVKSVVGTIRSPSDKAVLPFVAQDAGGNGEFAARISIPPQAETGDWFVGTVQIVDRANNPFSARFVRATVPPGGALRVASNDSDSTAPTVRRVFVERGTVGGGEKNQVSIDVDDDRSGVASVTGTFQSPSKSAFIAFSGTSSGESSWTGVLTVPAAADCGEWTLRQLRVADKANNSAILMSDSPQLGRVSFIVTGGGECDSEPPILDTLYLAPVVVSNTAAAEVVLTVTAHDEGSGVGALSGRIEGPAAANGQIPKIFFSSLPDPKSPDAPMIARIAVPQYAANGIWRVVVVELTDKARNKHAYNGTDPALANAYFTVE